MNHIAFSIKPIPPFRLDLTVWTLRRRPDNVVDRWDGEAYRRALLVNDKPVLVTVSQTGQPDEARLEIAATGPSLTSKIEPAVVTLLERLLGLQTDLTAFYRLGACHSNLQSVMQRFRGVKPPRFPTLFETLVNAIACQQLSLTVGIRLLNRLAEAHGPAVQGQATVFHAFPDPEALAALEPEALRSLGFSYQKARAIVELGQGVAGNGLKLDELTTLGDATAVRHLCQIYGVGRWTAEYVLLRGLGRLHIFPGDDVGARNTLQHWLGLRQPLDYEGVGRAVARWRPYAGLVYFHLLLKRLAETGCLS